MQKGEVRKKRGVRRRVREREEMNRNRKRRRGGGEIGGGIGGKGVKGEHNIICTRHADHMKDVFVY